MEGTAKAMATLFTGAIVNDGGWQRSYFTRGDHIQTSHRKEVTLHVGSVLKIRGHPRDLVQVGSDTVNVWFQVMVNAWIMLMFQVMVNGVNVNPPLLTTSDLQRTFGSWAVRDAEFTFLDEIEV